MSHRWSLPMTRHLVLVLLNNLIKISILLLLTLNVTSLWLMWLLRNSIILCSCINEPLNLPWTYPRLQPFIVLLSTSTLQLTSVPFHDALVMFFQKDLFVTCMTLEIYFWLSHLQYHVPATRWQTVKAQSQNSIVLSSLTLSLTGDILWHIKDSLKRNCTRWATVDCWHFLTSSPREKKQNISKVNMIFKHTLIQHIAAVSVSWKPWNIPMETIDQSDTCTWTALWIRALRDRPDHKPG